jgi:threonylcarbamoyladenosine tRNA methylthiotransferase MtaB
VSLDPEKVVERVRALESRGYRETTLAGVNISQYKSGSLDFSGLLELLVGTTENIRFRVSSFEPDRVDERFAAAVSHGRVRPHFHLPLQSGSSDILRAMRRQYAPQCVIEACARLRKAKEDPFIAADVIVGFPGETEKDFLDTRSLCENLGFAWIHVFPFSPRPGTEAASLKPHIPERIAVERLAELAGLAERGKSAYVDRWIGRSVEAIVESGFDDGSGDSLATTENYIKVRIRGLDIEKSEKGACVNCRIMGKGEKNFDAIAVPSP